MMSAGESMPMQSRSTNLTNELNFNRYGRNLEVSPVLFFSGSGVSRVNDASGRGGGGRCGGYRRGRPPG